MTQLKKHWVILAQPFSSFAIYYWSLRQKKGKGLLINLIWQFHFPRVRLQANWSIDSHTQTHTLKDIYAQYITLISLTYNVNNNQCDTWIREPKRNQRGKIIAICDLNQFSRSSISANYFFPYIKYIYNNHFLLTNLKLKI